LKKKYLITLISGFLAACTFLASPAGAVCFEQEVLRQIYDQLHEAICTLTFTQEATDPRTGEQKRQNGNAVALIVSPGGLLITNGHLQIENIHAFNFRAHVRRGGEETQYAAVLLEKPQDINLSFLRIQCEAPLTLPFVRFQRGSRLSLGEPVALVGVLGETLDFQRAVVTDRVCAVLEEPRITYCLTSGLRLGFVTSPVVNAQGEVVGISGFDLGRNEGGDALARPGHPLVFQTDLFIHHVDAPPDISAGAMRDEEAWLGVFTQPLTEEYAAYWGMEEAGGLIVSTVVPDSPAAEAGLAPGDIILRFDGIPVRATIDRDVFVFTKMVRESEPNKVVELGLLRDGAEKTIHATLGLRPRSALDAEEYTDETFGLVVREITRDLRILLNLGEDVSGVIVRRVISGGPAHLARIQPGVIIMTLGDYPVTGLDDFEEAVEKVKARKPSEVSVFARVGTATGFFRLRPRW